MAKRKRQPRRKAKRAAKSAVGESRRRNQRHAVRLQVVKARKGYRWRTMRATGGRGTPIAISGNLFTKARSAAYHGRNMNPHLVIRKVEYL